SPRKLADVSVVGAGGLSWSPDGERVVYSASAGDWPGLWIVSVSDGKIQRLMTPGSDAASEPAWSPTGDMIAYMSVATTGTAVSRLAFVNSSGQSSPKTLPVPPGVNGFANGMAAWSPDGRRLAAFMQQANTSASIWIVEPDASNPYRKLIDLPTGPRLRGITWTPDGSAVIVGKYDTSSDIVLMDGTM